MLLIELAMETVNKEEEGKEDEEDKRSTAKYQQEIGYLLCCWHTRARSTQSALRCRIAPLPGPFFILHFSTSHPYRYMYKAQVSCCPPLRS
jgi:hypothetical protein